MMQWVRIFSSRRKPDRLREVQSIRIATEISDYELALKPLRAITLMENPSPVTHPMALL
jgi:hypothetical protein